MRYLITLIIMLVSLCIASSNTFAWRNKKPVTPYGDFCPRFSNYGVKKSHLSSEKARMALKDYYDKKGLIVMIEDIRGRFIKAKIIEKDKVVDVIILDSHTGRIRSIY